MWVPRGVATVCTPVQDPSGVLHVLGPEEEGVASQYKVVQVSAGVNHSAAIIEGPA